MSSRWIKTALLVITLAAPVLIYLFLQSFGENRYQVTLYYPQGIEAPLSGCHDGNQPHQISQLPGKNWQNDAVKSEDLRDQLTVISFLNPACESHKPVLDEVARVCNNYRDDQRVKGITLAVNPKVDNNLYQQRSAAYNLRVDNWDLISWDSTTKQVVNCALNLPHDCTTSTTLVLVDGKRQIRGYYLAEDKEEVDRLITEIEILLVNGEDRSN